MISSQPGRSRIGGTPRKAGRVETTIAEWGLKWRHVCRQDSDVDTVSHALDGTSSVDGDRAEPHRPLALRVMRLSAQRPTNAKQLTFVVRSAGPCACC
jgi:hypothetical protein